MLRTELLDSLPHGSGINGDWTMDETKSFIRYHNIFDIMNDVGAYVAYAPFSILIPRNGDLQDFRLIFRCLGSETYWVRKTGLREYLEDTFAEYFRSLEN